MLEGHHVSCGATASLYLGAVLLDPGLHLLRLMLNIGQGMLGSSRFLGHFTTGCLGVGHGFAGGDNLRVRGQNLHGPVDLHDLRVQRLQVQ